MAHQDMPHPIREQQSSPVRPFKYGAQICTMSQGGTLKGSFAPGHGVLISTFPNIDALGGHGLVVGGEKGTHRAMGPI